MRSSHFLSFLVCGAVALAGCGDDTTATGGSPSGGAPAGGGGAGGAGAQGGGGAAECAAPLELCGADCVDTSTDSEHCGACDAPCDATQTCVDGQCECDAGLTDCAGECVDLSGDTAHCGACDIECLAGQTCDQGDCSACPNGTTACDATGTCADTQTDTANCGGCGIDCGAGGDVHRRALHLRGLAVVLRRRGLQGPLLRRRQLRQLHQRLSRGPSLRVRRMRGLPRRYRGVHLPGRVRGSVR
ncbi:MAG: hypothetical protein IPG04_34050 [Polyangiaceae bacterium]|nr:hypothetical protein [Polyangiaceae bacterium]